MDYSQLKTEIETGELAAALAGKSRAEKLAILNVQDRLRSGSIPITLLLQWSAANGVLAKIQDHSNNATSPVRSPSLALLLRLNDPSGVLTMDARNRAMVTGFVSAGILTTAQATELDSLSPVSFAEIKFGRLVTEDDLGRIGQ